MTSHGRIKLKRNLEGLSGDIKSGNSGSKTDALGFQPESTHKSKSEDMPVNKLSTNGQDCTSASASPISFNLKRSASSAVANSTSGAFTKTNLSDASDDSKCKENSKSQSKSKILLKRPNLANKEVDIFEEDTSNKKDDDVNSPSESCHHDEETCERIDVPITNICKDSLTVSVRRSNGSAPLDWPTEFILLTKTEPALIYSVNPLHFSFISNENARPDGEATKKKRKHKKKSKKSKKVKDAVIADENKEDNSNLENTIVEDKTVDDSKKQNPNKKKKKKSKSKKKKKSKKGTNDSEKSKKSKKKKSKRDKSKHSDKTTEKNAPNKPIVTEILAQTSEKVTNDKFDVKSSDKPKLKSKKVKKDGHSLVAYSSDDEEEDKNATSCDNKLTDSGNIDHSIDKKPVVKLEPKVADGDNKESVNNSGLVNDANVKSETNTSTSTKQTVKGTEKSGWDSSDSEFGDTLSKKPTTDAKTQPAVVKENSTKRKSRSRHSSANSEKSGRKNRRRSYSSRSSSYSRSRSDSRSSRSYSRSRSRRRRRRSGSSYYSYSTSRSYSSSSYTSHSSRSSYGSSYSRSRTRSYSSYSRSSSSRSRSRSCSSCDHKSSRHKGKYGSRRDSPRRSRSRSRLKDSHRSLSPSYKDNKDLARIRRIQQKKTAGAGNSKSNNVPANVMADILNKPNSSQPDKQSFGPYLPGEDPYEKKGDISPGSNTGSIKDSAGLDIPLPKEKPKGGSGNKPMPGQWCPSMDFGGPANKKKVARKNKESAQNIPLPSSNNKDSGSTYIGPQVPAKMAKTLGLDVSNKSTVPATANPQKRKAEDKTSEASMAKRSPVRPAFVIPPEQAEQYKALQEQAKKHALKRTGVVVSDSSASNSPDPISQPESTVQQLVTASLNNITQEQLLGSTALPQGSILTQSALQRLQLLHHHQLVSAAAETSVAGSVYSQAHIPLISSAVQASQANALMMAMAQASQAAAGGGAGVSIATATPSAGAVTTSSGMVPMTTPHVIPVSLLQQQHQHQQQQLLQQQLLARLNPLLAAGGSINPAVLAQLQQHQQAMLAAGQSQGTSAGGAGAHTILAAGPDGRLVQIVHPALSQHPHLLQQALIAQQQQQQQQQQQALLVQQAAAQHQHVAAAQQQHQILALALAQQAQAQQSQHAAAHQAQILQQAQAMQVLQAQAAAAAAAAAQQQSGATTSTITTTPSTVSSAALSSGVTTTPSTVLGQNPLVTVSAATLPVVSQTSASSITSNSLTQPPVSVTPTGSGAPTNSQSAATTGSLPLQSLSLPTTAAPPSCQPVPSICQAAVGLANPPPLLGGAAAPMNPALQAGLRPQQPRPTL